MKYLFWNATDAEIEYIRLHGLRLSQLSEAPVIAPHQTLIVIPVISAQQHFHISIGRKYSFLEANLTTSMLQEMSKLYPEEASWGGKYEQLVNYIASKSIIPNMLEYHRLINFTKSLAQDKMEKNTNVGIFRFIRALQDRKINALCCRMQIPSEIIDF